MVGPLKKSVTFWPSPRLIRGCCSIGRGQKCVVFLKLIFQLQTRSGSATARSLKTRSASAIARSLKEGIVTQPELTCKELTELITDYLEERLSQTDRIRFEQHLSVCRGCVAYVDQMRVTIQAMGSKPPLKIPSSIEESLLEAFRRWKNPNH
jgi:putative zinc finger protein